MIGVILAIHILEMETITLRQIDQTNLLSKTVTVTFSKFIPQKFILGRYPF